MNNFSDYFENVSGLLTIRCYGCNKTFCLDYEHSKDKDCKYKEDLQYMSSVPTLYCYCQRCGELVSINLVKCKDENMDIYHEWPKYIKVLRESLPNRPWYKFW